MSKSYIHYRSIRNGELNAKGGATVALRMINGVLYYSIAMCNKRDHFNKKIGRQVADGRIDAIRKGRRVQHVFMTNISCDADPVIAVIEKVKSHMKRHRLTISKAVAE